MIDIKLVNDLISKSTFYRDFYKLDSFTNFNHIPFLSKQDLLNDQITNPPFGSNLSVNRDKLVRIHRTSGTTNRPLLIALTKNDLDVVQKVGAKAFKLAGVKDDDIVFNCMNYSMWMGGFTDHLSLEKVGACVIPYGVGKTESLISLLLEMEDSSLHCTPSYLNVIKRVLKDKFLKNPRDLRLKKGFFGGEGGLQNKAYRDRIEKEWGIEAVNANYGMSDVISIMGAECSQREGLHFVAMEYLFIELIDADQKKVELKDGAIGELVVTTLQKEAQPLIRYRTGDIIQILSTLICKCGDDSFRFKVVGRADDMITVKGINFYPESLKSIISKYNEFSANYIIQIKDEEPIEEITLILEKNNESYQEALDDIISEIKSKYYFTPSIKVVDSVDTGDNKMKILRKVGV